MTRRTFAFTPALFVPGAVPAKAELPRLHWGDSSRLGRPFAKDPSVIRFGGRYLLYYSMPGQKAPGKSAGWAVGIAAGKDLYEWTKVGEFLPGADYEAKGVAAPFARVIGQKVHLFYQTYGNGPKDGICHAVSADGLNFERDASNPIFHPTGNWNSGRAIDAEVVQFRGRWFLYAATRDPQSRVQMLVGAASGGGFERNAWKMVQDASILKPELPWEQNCIEAPATVEHNGTLFMFYAGAYNNAPQQIGLARSADGIRWQRVSDTPFLPVGQAGTWNSSESGHPGVFVDDDRQTYLFYQGNNDNGRTWFISVAKIGWKNGLPVLAAN